MTQLKVAQIGHVLELTHPGDLRRRLVDLGMTRGARVERTFASPAGDPVCYRIRGALIALRAVDAKQVRVTV